MREIKFRVWDKFQKKYVFIGFHIIGEVTCFSGIESVINETWKERKKKFKYAGTIQAFNDFVLEQFTGLLDKNGKEIYEGDILHSYYGEKGNIVGFVDYRAFEFVIWKRPVKSWYSFGCVRGEEGKIYEVVGNKFENPELLKR